MIKKSECLAISGPPKIPAPYYWYANKSPHRGIPSKMDFAWYTFKESDFKI